MKLVGLSRLLQGASAGVQELPREGEQEGGLANLTGGCVLWEGCG